MSGENFIRTTHEIRMKKNGKINELQRCQTFCFKFINK